MKPFVVVWNGTPYRAHDTRAEADAEAVRLRRWASTSDTIRVVERRGGGRRHAS